MSPIWLQQSQLRSSGSQQAASSSNPLQPAPPSSSWRGRPLQTSPHPGPAVFPAIPFTHGSGCPPWGRRFTGDPLQRAGLLGKHRVICSSDLWIWGASWVLHHPSCLGASKAHFLSLTFLHHAERGLVCRQSSQQAEGPLLCLPCWSPEMHNCSLLLTAFHLRWWQTPPSRWPHHHHHQGFSGGLTEPR